MLWQLCGGKSWAFCDYLKDPSMEPASIADWPVIFLVSRDKKREHWAFVSSGCFSSNGFMGCFAKYPSLPLFVDIPCQYDSYNSYALRTKKFKVGEWRPAFSCSAPLPTAQMMEMLESPQSYSAVQLQNTSWIWRSEGSLPSGYWGVNTSIPPS